MFCQVKTLCIQKLYTQFKNVTLETKCTQFFTFIIIILIKKLNTRSVRSFNFSSSPQNILYKYLQGINNNFVVYIFLFILFNFLCVSCKNSVNWINFSILTHVLFTLQSLTFVIKILLQLWYINFSDSKLCILHVNTSKYFKLLVNYM